MRDKISRIKSIKETAEGEIEVVVVMDKQKLADEFIPYYDIKDIIKKEVAPILVEEVLKNKEAMVKDVLLNVDWSDIVRSEVAQKVIQEIAKKGSY